MNQPFQKLPTFLFHPEKPDTIFYTQEEVDAALADGWSEEGRMKKDSSDSGKTTKSGSDSPEFMDMNLADLKAYARKLGLVISGNVSLKTLQAKVAEALAAK